VSVFEADVAPEILPHYALPGGVKTLIEILFELLGKVFKLLGVLIQDKVDGLHLHVYTTVYI
jgi:hypothetical protein